MAVGVTAGRGEGVGGAGRFVAASRRTTGAEWISVCRFKLSSFVSRILGYNSQEVCVCRMECVSVGGGGVGGSGEGED